ncbi:MAG: hypothetical protein ACOH1H_08270 [Brevundimonas sp.]|jgi:hypothetical protein
MINGGQVIVRSRDAGAMRDLLREGPDLPAVDAPTAPGRTPAARYTPA